MVVMDVANEQDFHPGGCCETERLTVTYAEWDNSIKMHHIHNNDIHKQNHVTDVAGEI